MYLYGKSSDLHSWEIPHLNINDDGYAPLIPKVCGGDDINIAFCLDCGQIQNFTPLSDNDLKEILNIEEPEELEDDPLYNSHLGY
jgi:hypothetical protein